MPNATIHRILVADDEAVIVEIYRAVFAPTSTADDGLADLEAEFFDATLAEAADGTDYEIEIVRQGDQSVAAVRKAVMDGAPYSAVFLDVRMPPGISGVEAARRIREIDETVGIVFVTGYSDVPKTDIKRTVPPPDRLF